MASNDMNSWDEDPDESIRRHWRQTFADFEVQSRPSLRRRILGQLPTRPRPASAYWLVVSALLLLGGSGLYWRTRAKDPVVLRNIATHHQRGDRAKLLTASKSVTYRPAKARMAAGREMVAGRHPAPDQRFFDSQLQPKSHLGEIWSTKTSMPSVKAKPIRSAPEAKPVAQPTHPDSPIQFREEAGNHVNLYAVIKPLPELQRMSHWPTKPLEVTPLILATKPLPPISSTANSSRPGKSRVQYSSHRWFIEVAPLSSFQWMSTPPASPVYLSQVKAPAALSPATWGYQLSLGLDFRHWKAQLSAGHLRRWAYYTINENRYRLEPSLADPYQLVRESYAVTENVLSPMVGIGLGQRRLLGRDRYTAELGGQLWYLPTEDQTLLSLRGGVSRRLIRTRTEWQVGLSASYGLNQLLSEHHHMTIHPLVVGFTLRMKPTGKSVQD